MDDDTFNTEISDNDFLMVDFLLIIKSIESK